MNILLALLMTIQITLKVKQKAEPWAKCDMDICVFENPTKRPIKMHFQCGEEYEPFSVLVEPKEQNQLMVNNPKAFCTFEHWEYVRK